MGQYTGLENKKILVVEDVELNQFLARHIMESWGCVVHIVENGALAVDRISNEDFDLVLMDIQMPVMDGIQATKQIRDMVDKSKASIPIVALTANAMRSDFDRYLGAGMNDCLPKPFEEPALYHTVYKHIRKKETMSMNESPARTEPAQVAEPVSKLYDLSMVETIAGGDKSFIQKMLKLFLDTVPASLKEMRTVAEKRNWAELSKVAHKLKSTVDSMGIVQARDSIREIEMNSKAGINVEALPAQVKAAIEVMEKVIQQIKKDHSL